MTDPPSGVKGMAIEKVTDREMDRLDILSSKADSGKVRLIIC
jgi:hypothetical protein